uniref:Uncharacterized protein n=1 Tax=Kalanchoe fedtschenkoi TaxID=63787 RepID=A0A7N0TR51_KALFE
MSITKHTRSVFVYGGSWIVIAFILLVMKSISVGRRRFSASFQLAFLLIKGLIFIAFVSILITLLALPLVSVEDIIVCVLACLPTGWGILLIAQACNPSVKRAGFWGSVRTLACGYEVMMGLLLFTPVAFLAWFPFVSEFQTRMLFNQAFSRGLQISCILGGQRKDRQATNSSTAVAMRCVVSQGTIDPHPCLSSPRHLSENIHTRLVVPHLFTSQPWFSVTILIHC